MSRIWPRSFCVSSAATARKRNEAPADDIQPGKTRSITETVFFLNSSWFWTDLSFVSQACKLLSDDYEQVRSAAVQMVWVLSQLYPERWTNRFIYYSVINTWFMEFYMLYIFVCPIFCMKVRNIFFSSPHPSHCHAASSPFLHPTRRSGWSMTLSGRSATWLAMAPGLCACRLPSCWCILLLFFLIDGF